MFLKNPLNEIEIEFYSCVSSEIYNCFRIYCYFERYFWKQNNRVLIKAEKKENM